MSRLRVASAVAAAAGIVVEVTPDSAGWSFVGFRVIRLAAGLCSEGGEDGRETCVVILSGRVDVEADGQVFTGLGGRQNVFEGLPVAIYLPAGVRYAMRSDAGAEVAVCTAPGSTTRPIRVISPDDMQEEVRGTGTTTRYVRNILPDSAEADSLLVVEVITPPGHWSSYPPHKHDTDLADAETALEETYYHRLSPAGGFAFQRIYTDDKAIDEAIAVADGDVILVPRGYHPVSAPPERTLYYLNVMAGPRRLWRFANDPVHAPRG